MESRQKMVVLFHIIMAILMAAPATAFAALSQSSPSGEEVWRLDCGAANDYTAPDGNGWTKDEGYTSLYRWGFANGATASTSATITGTPTPEIYKTNRWGGNNMSYKIEVPNGTYRVRLMFAETYWDAPGQRVFNVALEGVTTWSYVDIYAWAAGKFKAMDLTADVTVTDGVLDVGFPVVHNDNACLSGIEVKVLSVTNDSFLDFIQKKMFWYFWNEADPQTGLVKWGEDNWQIGYGNVSSIAVCGYAISIYTIAADRGWISRDAAYQRVRKLLDTFETTLQNVHGFWWHFVHTATGARDGTTEISTVDSTLFILGALQAAEYFRNDHPDIAAQADLLYRRMDWTWFLNVSNGDDFQKRFVNQGWKPEFQIGSPHSFNIPSGKPEGGYYVNDWWNRYSESVFIDLLALGSPTHPIASNAWTDMQRWWVDAYGYHFVQEPPLFTHQYHHLYFDLQNKHDGIVDYVDNTRKGTLTNRLTCVNDSLGRYEPKRWGLSGSGGPDGNYHAYGGDPGGSHDGTVAPTAATTSLVFTPTESMETARYMYFQYKHHIWGRYGFSDGFNVGQSWRHWAVNGLNNGAMVIGIENFRSGMVVNTFMQNPYAASALSAAGFRSFAQEPLYTASTGAARDAFDDNMGTRWASVQADPQWIEADFGEGRTFDNVVIQWEVAYGKSYKIQVSWDAVNWVDVYATTSGNGGEDVVTFPLTTARYWRLYGTERGTPWGYSIWEMNFDNTVNFAQGRPAASSSVEGPGMEAGNAVDGNDATRWASQWSDPQWMHVDLGAPMTISRVTLKWEYASGRNFNIQTSNDAVNWTTVAEVANSDGGVDEVPFTAVTARFVRMYGTARNTPYGFSLWELQVQ